MKRILKIFLQITLPFALAAGILWWMYRDTAWDSFLHTLREGMRWEWMWASLAVGVLPGVLRGLRWRMALAPAGERPRYSTLIDAVFISYAASLVVPRIGEITRCGTLRRQDGTSFTKALGTVVSERAVDSILILLLTVGAMFSQLPALVSFLRQTGMTPRLLLERFSSTGYIVTTVCILVAVVFACFLLRHYQAYAERHPLLRRGQTLLADIWAGVRSLGGIRRPWLYLAYSLGIWMAYFLHFYLAFFCFDATASVSPAAAFLIFCIGSFAVLVPTPNGAGPWHFAVKTMLVIYGVAEAPAVMFALIVHTVQTALVVVLGGWGVMDLALRGKRTPVPSEIN